MLVYNLEIVLLQAFVIYFIIIELVLELGIFV